MLFVDDGQTQLVELDCFLNDRVRADARRGFRRRRVDLKFFASQPPSVMPVSSSTR